MSEVGGYRQGESDPAKILLKFWLLGIMGDWSEARKYDCVQETECAQRIECAQKLDHAQESDHTQESDFAQESDCTQESGSVKKPGSAPKPGFLNKPDCARNHTVLVLQSVKDVESRTWSDYETSSRCLSDICQAFELYLKKHNPDATTIAYDIREVYKFVDHFADLTCLVADGGGLAYAPHGKPWTKQEIYTALRTRLS